MKMKDGARTRDGDSQSHPRHATNSDEQRRGLGIQQHKKEDYNPVHPNRPFM